MTEVTLVARPAVAADVEHAFEWYESQLEGLGDHFLEQLRDTYRRIARGAEAYPLIAPEIRRALLRRFPYAVYYVTEPGKAVVLAVLHVARDPAEWQRRG